MPEWVHRVRPRPPGQRSFIIDHPAGWAIMPIHYSMFDAATPGWLAAQQQLYMIEEGRTDNDWEQEMEINMGLVSGVRCYSSFAWETNTRHEVPFDPMRPIKLCCDFNVTIKAWNIVQEIHGRFYASNEISIVGSQATIPRMITLFRMAYPAHPGGIQVYGDATGKARGSGADNQSCYDLIKIGLAGYPSVVEYKVPASNPPPTLRINSVNAALKGIEGEPVFVAHREKCHYLISDLLEVVYHKDGRHEEQITDNANPKHLLTHASAGVGYMLAIERPTSALAAKLRTRESKKKINLHKGRRLGRL